MTRERVLFLCTHNSARSQMAEGFLRAIAGDRFEVESAGTEQTRVHPLAIRAMQEVGVDLEGQRSKTLDRFLDQPWDHVISVCDSANERCPIFPRSIDVHGGVQARRMGWGWAFASLGIAAAGAVMAAICLHRLPAARALTTGHGRLVSQKGGTRP
jgi:protein-tyrosine-phosphatase